MAASRTAHYVALYRALETDERRRAPLFRDPFARAFLPRGLALLARLARAPLVRGWIERYSDLRAPGARTSAIARTAYIDDAVRDAVASGIDQVVILGAGYDCRAHRMPELRGARIYEVDRADTQAAKRVRLAEATHVRYVAVDFLRDEIAAQLEAAGWDPRRRSMVIWEGVTNYLTEPAVRRVLDWIGGTAPGTRVVFTYVHGGLIDGSVDFPGGRRMVNNVRRLGEPWTFGVLPGEVAQLVARSGLQLRENLGADDYRRRYLEDGSAAGYAFYRIALAEVPAPGVA